MNRLNILYTCDDSYLSLTGISIASVIENNPDRDIYFYIATEKDEHTENFRQLIDFYKNNKNISFRHLDCKKYDDLLQSNQLDRWGSNSYYVYWKLFAYDLLNEDEIWYLDSDVICIKEIDELKIDKAVGAVIDCAHADFNKIAGINENYYFFNTGSLYVDVNKWKQNKCVDKVINYINNMKTKPLMCDQDILAIALQDDIQVIDPKYDYLVGYDYYGVHNVFKMYSLDKKPFYSEEDIINAKDKIIFYHCLGGVFGRPWQKGNSSPIKDEFKKYTELSPWKEFETDFNQSLLFKIEKTLEILPHSIYNKIHNIAQRIYLRNLSKNINR